MINKLLICFGTRPEWIKVKPIIERLKSKNVQHSTLFTSQHKDLVKESADYMLPMIEDIGNNRLDSIVSGILKSVDGIIDNYDYILVQGDTTSVFSLLRITLNLLEKLSFNILNILLYLPSLFITKISVEFNILIP